MVYGYNDAHGSENLWSSLCTLSASVTKWIVLEDFNIIRDATEKISNIPPVLADITAFNDCLCYCQLDDLRGSGCDFTWTNKQADGTRVWSKLDRALVNSNWLTHFPNTYVDFLPAGLSDYSPVLVTLFEEIKAKARFSFLNCWISHPNYHSIIKEAWHHYEPGTAIHRLFSKLKRVKQALIHLHRQDYSNMEQRIKHAQQHLFSCQLELQQDPLSEALIKKEKMMSDQYYSLKKHELSILKQRAKAENIIDGDSASKYFFAKMKERKYYNIIGKIKDHNGRERKGMQDVAAGFIQYYHKLLGITQDITPMDATFIQKGSCVRQEDHSSLT
ncbi:uncharacterized protein LOC141620173 [Silene latifolia]|uniref:uncharacterized protein LOC141620173 n=1 Tax=Silene latifolia TaxID=37657 RepID=UPI003D787121